MYIGFQKNLKLGNAQVGFEIKLSIFSVCVLKIWQIYQW